MSRRDMLALHETRVKPRKKPKKKEAPESVSMSNSKAEIVAYAESIGVEFETSWTKQEILDAIEAHES